MIFDWSLVTRTTNALEAFGGSVKNSKSLYFPISEHYQCHIFTQSICEEDSHTATFMIIDGFNVKSTGGAETQEVI